MADPEGPEAMETDDASHAVEENNMVMDEEKAASSEENCSAQAEVTNDDADDARDDERASQHEHTSEARSRSPEGRSTESCSKADQEQECMEAEQITSEHTTAGIASSQAVSHEPDANQHGAEASADASSDKLVKENAEQDPSDQQDPASAAQEPEPQEDARKQGKDAEIIIDDKEGEYKEYENDAEKQEDRDLEGDEYNEYKEKEFEPETGDVSIMDTSTVSIKREAEDYIEGEPENKQSRVGEKRSSQKSTALPVVVSSLHQLLAACSSAMCGKMSPANIRATGLIAVCSSMQVLTPSVLGIPDGPLSESAHFRIFRGSELSVQVLLLRQNEPLVLGFPEDVAGVFR